MEDLKLDHIYTYIYNVSILYNVSNTYEYAVAPIRKNEQGDGGQTL